MHNRHWLRDNSRWLANLAENPPSQKSHGVYIGANRPALQTPKKSALWCCESCATSNLRWTKIALRDSRRLLQTVKNRRWWLTWEQLQKPGPLALSHRIHCPNQNSGNLQACRYELCPFRISEIFVRVKLAQPKMKLSSPK